MCARRSNSGPGGGELDDIDRAMLEILVEDGRASAQDIARRLSISRSNAYARLNRLRASGTLRAVRAEVDPAALGYPITAMILVNADQHAWEEVRAQLVLLPGCEYLAMTSGEFDFIVVVHVRDVPALRDVVLQRLHRIEGVRSTRTVFVLDEERRPVGSALTAPQARPGPPERPPPSAGPGPMKRR